MDFIKTVGAASLLLVTSFSNAAIINYDEAISGDLSLNDFTFDTVGNQTFKGNASVNMSGGVFSQDGDLFDFSILSGLEVTDVIFNTTLVDSINVSNAAARTSIRNNGIVYYRDTIDFLGSTSGGVVDVNNLPIGQATNLYRTGAGGTNLVLIDSNEDYSISFDWELTFKVENASAQVPEPAALSLFAMGILGLTIGRRKKA